MIDTMKLPVFNKPNEGDAKSPIEEAITFPEESIQDTDESGVSITEVEVNRSLSDLQMIWGVPHLMVISRIANFLGDTEDIPDTESAIYQKITIILNDPVMLSRVLGLHALKMAKEGKQSPMLNELYGGAQAGTHLRENYTLASVIEGVAKGTRPMAKKVDDAQAFVTERIYRSLQIPSDATREVDTIKAFEMLSYPSPRTIQFLRTNLQHVHDILQKSIAQDEKKAALGKKTLFKDWQRHYLQYYLLPKIILPVDDSENGHITAAMFTFYRNVLWAADTASLCDVGTVKSSSLVQNSSAEITKLQCIHDNQSAGDIFDIHSMLFFKDQKGTDRGIQKVNRKEHSDFFSKLQKYDADLDLSVKVPQTVIGAFQRNKGRFTMNTMESQFTKSQSSDELRNWDITQGLERGGSLEKLIKSIKGGAKIWGIKDGQKPVLAALAQYQSLNASIDNQEKNKRGEWSLSQSFDALRPYITTEGATHTKTYKQRIKEATTFINNVKSFQGNLFSAPEGLRKTIKDLESSENSEALGATVYQLILDAYQNLIKSFDSNREILDQSIASVQKKILEWETADAALKDSRKKNLKDTPQKESLPKKKPQLPIVMKKIDTFSNDPLATFDYIKKQAPKITIKVLEIAQNARDPETEFELPKPLSEYAYVRDIRIMMGAYVKHMDTNPEENVANIYLIMNGLTSVLDSGQLLDSENENMDKLIVELLELLENLNTK